MDETPLRTEFFPGCLSLGFNGDIVVLTVDEWTQAWNLNQSHLRYLAGLAKFLEKKQLEIHHNTPDKPPIPILAKMADIGDAKIVRSWEAQFIKFDQIKRQKINDADRQQQYDRGGDMSSLKWQTAEEVIANLRNVDARRLLEFEIEMLDRNLIVSFTSQRTNSCIKSGDLAYAVLGRSIWKPYKYRGFNYLIAWDTDFSGKPSDEFVQMQDCLTNDLFVPNFDYNLRRPGDNALVRYQSSFYLFPDPAGEPGGIRACVSNPQDFRVIEEGDLILASR